MKLKIVLIFTYAVTISCSDQTETSAKNTENVIKDTLSTNKVNTLTDENPYFSAQEIFYTQKVLHAIETNNKDEYVECATWFRWKSPYSDTFMYFAIQMAYENNLPEAYHDILRLYEFRERGKESANPAFYNFLLYNLARANELGLEITEYEIHGEKINKNNIKNSGYYLNQMPHK